MQTQKTAPAAALFAAFGLMGALCAPISAQAAQIPAYAANAAHPPVAQSMGPVKANICQWSENEASIVDEALGKLRDQAGARGASALVGFRYRMVETHPRAQVCRRYLEAQAEAVHLDGARAHALADQ